jgi:hypothetical protein
MIWKLTFRIKQHSVYGVNIPYKVNIPQSTLNIPYEVNIPYTFRIKSTFLNIPYEVNIMFTLQVVSLPRKVDIRLPGKGNSNSRGARPVY